MKADSYPLHDVGLLRSIAVAAPPSPTKLALLLHSACRHGGRTRPPLEVRALLLGHWHGIGPEGWAQVDGPTVARACASSVGFWPGFMADALLRALEGFDMPTGGERLRLWRELWEVARRLREPFPAPAEDRWQFWRDAGQVGESSREYEDGFGWLGLAMMVAAQVMRENAHDPWRFVECAALARASGNRAENRPYPAAGWLWLLTFRLLMLDHVAREAAASE